MTNGVIKTPPPMPKAEVTKAPPKTRTIKIARRGVPGEAHEPKIDAIAFSIYDPICNPLFFFPSATAL